MAGTPGAALQLLSIVSFQFPLFDLIDLLGNLGIGNVMGRQTERIACLRSAMSAGGLSEKQT
jgi:hypothetical protein